jgi:hypothetical protein
MSFIFRLKTCHFDESSAPSGIIKSSFTYSTIPQDTETERAVTPSIDGEAASKQQLCFFTAGWPPKRVFHLNKRDFIPLQVEVDKDLEYFQFAIIIKLSR